MNSSKISVVIDRSKCLGPIECGKCLKVCPPGVFIAYPVNREKGKICNVYNVEAIHEDQCIFCYECVKVCPTSAIEVKTNSDDER